MRSPAHGWSSGAVFPVGRKVTGPSDGNQARCLHSLEKRPDMVPSEGGALRGTLAPETGFVSPSGRGGSRHLLRDAEYPEASSKKSETNFQSNLPKEANARWFPGGPDTLGPPGGEGVKSWRAQLAGSTLKVSFSPGEFRRGGVIGENTCQRGNWLLPLELSSWLRFTIHCLGFN